LKLVGRVPAENLLDGRMTRLDYPPFHVLVALVENVPCAIEDACNHAGASLSQGQRSGRCVICPMHGYAFDLSTGALVSPRGLCAGQRRFVARVEGADVVVWDPGSEVAVLGP
jgi:nitrite reductase/ring-hydroxylating ferredoxin subunit